MKMVYTLSFLVFFTSSFPTLAVAALDVNNADLEASIERDNQTPVTEFDPSAKHVGMSYCKECGKYVYSAPSISEGAAISPVGDAAKTPDGAAKAKSSK